MLEEASSLDNRLAQEHVSVSLRMQILGVRSYGHIFF